MKRRWVSGPIEASELEMILVAVELGYTYREKGYPLEEAKRETIKQLTVRHGEPSNE